MESTTDHRADPRDRMDEEIIEFGMSFEDLVAALRTGIADGREQDVYDALDQRRTLIAATVVAQLRVGMRVMANQTCRPLHLRGAVGTVEELKPRSQKAVVRWDHDSRRWNMQGASLIPMPDQQ